LPSAFCQNKRNIEKSSRFLTIRQNYRDHTVATQKAQPEPPAVNFTNGYLVSPRRKKITFALREIRRSHPCRMDSDETPGLSQDDPEELSSILDQRFGRISKKCCP
jgi:hypothetical protein